MRIAAAAAVTTAAVTATLLAPATSAVAATLDPTPSAQATASAPGGPVAQPVATRALAGRQQVARLRVPTGTIAGLLTADGATTLHRYQPGRGNWALDPTTSTITFTPAKGWTGVARVSWALVDGTGRRSTARYVATVLPRPRRTP